MFRYAATVRVQKHRQEIIEDLATMVKEHLTMFYKSTGRNHIICFLHNIDLEDLKKHVSNCL